MAAMEQVQVDDIEKQMAKLRVALPVWGEEANDLVELAHNAERAAMQMDERTLQRMRRLLQTAAGWHDTLLYWEQQQAAPALSADIRVLRGSLDAMRTEVNAAASLFPGQET
ncbi:hypothetical protein ASC97_29745 [Rhizobium sp. Root1203]|jgi:hypothetical protein|uniref:hypothetical protein n=1 Tax=Rhizobium sp. Root1203 TaxID=1736427 RepID=UPI00070FABA8|nr:hypothetical protein [Rhizobium sp. Root1203]KQV18247.1 hypothetical protein ASC97_29745 [Rhizobium sp. Root1203]